MRPSGPPTPTCPQPCASGLIRWSPFTILRITAGLIDPKLMTEEQKRETPPVPQAVVRANPANGRKNFYAGAHASHVRGMPLEEGRALLRELTAIATQPKYTPSTHLARQRSRDLGQPLLPPPRAVPGTKSATAGSCIARRSRGSGLPRSKKRSGCNPFLIS